MRIVATAACLFIAALCGQAQEYRTNLTAVQVTEDNSVIRVEISLSRKTTFTSGYLKNPARFFVDLHGTSSKAAEIHPGGHAVDVLGRVRVAQFTADATRVVLDLKAEAEVAVRADPTDGKIFLTVAAKGNPGPGVVSPKTTNLTAESGRSATLGFVTHVETGGRTEIRLALDRSVTFRTGRLVHPDRFYVDLDNTRPGTEGLSTKTLAAGNALGLRVGRLNLTTTRVVVELREAADAVVQPQPDSADLVIRIGGLGSLITLEETETTSSRSMSGLPRTEIEALPEQSAVPAVPAWDRPVQVTAELAIPPLVLAPAVGVMPTLIAPTPDVAPAPPATAATAPVSTRVGIPRINFQPQLEDLLTAPERLGVAVSDFRQNQPRDGIPATEKTTAYISYDSENLYVGFICADTAGHVRGRMSKREDIADDDQVTVYLDTFKDGQRAYYFSVNPLGLQADGIISGTGGTDSRFDTVWYSDGHITADGFVALITIPFKSLRFGPESEQTWGVALSRTVRGKNETSFWPYVTQRQKSLVQQMGVAEGLEGISPARNIQLIPYGAFTGARISDGHTPGYRTQTDKRVGFDSKIILRNSLTLDFTVKPDFSQVESNDPQVTINRRFEVFFPEKRPFFLDNQNYFETPLNLLFTRRIAAPDYGTRLTGRIGRWSIGILGIDDRAPGKLALVGSPLAGHDTGVGVFRLLRDIGKDSNLGVLATESHFGNTLNRVYSFDARLRLSPTWYFTGQAAYSRDRRLDASGRLIESTGPGYVASLSRTGRNLSLGSTYEDYGKGFSAPLGFVPRVDVRRSTNSGAYLFRPTGGPIYDFGPTASFVVNWDHSGRLQDKSSYVSYRMDFAGPVGFEVFRQDTYEFYLGQGLRYHASGGSFYSNSIKQFTFYGSYSRGSGVNYTPAAGVLPFVGRAENGSLGFTWRPTTRMRFEDFYYYTRLLGPRTDGGNAPTAFVNHLERVKINYQFTKALSFRGILDYNFIAANTALFNSGRYKVFTPDFLLTYLLNYGTAVYVGYNQRAENLALDPDSPGYLRRTGPPTYLTSGQIYVKLSYLKRF